MWENGKGPREGLWSFGACLFFVFLVVGPTYINAQDEFEVKPTTTPRPKCERLPRENELFSSDNFPGNYKKDSNCLYLMKAGTGKRVLLTFFMFDTESNSRCSYDKVEVFDSNKTKIHKFCGQNSNNVHVLSTESELSFNFTSDRVQEKGGFLASWEQVDSDFVLKSNEEEGQFYLSYPTAFIEESPEKVCVELFNNVESGVTVTYKVYPYLDRSSEEERNEGSWEFKQEPTKSEEITLTKGEKSKCFSIILPKSSPPVSKGLVNFELKSDDSKFNSKNFRSIAIYQKENYPLIQTDKGQYKAGDIVKFRILVLDHNLKPTPAKQVDEIWVENPKSGRIQQWKKQPLSLGLLQQEFKLSEEPELGDWKIQFTAGPVSGRATFKVAEYVLPKFDVKITPPAAVLKDAQELEFKICAKYTHGGSVKGEIESIFSSTRPSIRRRDHREVPIEATVGDEDECGTLILNRNRLQHLTEKTQKIKLDVTFRERGTQTEETASWTGRLEDKPFKLEVKEGSDQFITGGFPYTGEFTVKNHDDSPRKEEVEVCVGFYRDIRPIRDEFNKRGIWSMDEVEIAEMGRRMASLEHSRKCRKETSDDGSIKFYVPMDNINKDLLKLIITAKATNYESNKETGMTQPSAKLNVGLTHSTANLTLSLKDKQRSSVKCGEEFKPRVYFSSEKDEQFILQYQALSKGTIIKSGRMNVKVQEGAQDNEDVMNGLIGSGSNRHVNLSPTEGGGRPTKVTSYQEVSLPRINYEVSPSLKLIVFVNRENVTLGDSYTYEVEPCQKHEVTVNFLEEKVNPGAPVTLHVGAKPGSLCGVSATDKSVELLGNNNKITRDTVSKIQAQIGDRKTSRSENYWEYQRKCPKSYEVFKVFENSGVKVITDLPIIRSCQLLTDAINAPDYPFEPQYHSDSGGFPGIAGTSVAFSSFAAPQAVMAEEIQYKESSIGSYPPPIPAEALLDEGLLTKPKVDLRNFFPENWLFSLENITSSCLMRNLNAPHTLTTWVGEAFCIHEEEGLGVAEPDNLLVKQDFFAEINLPYSVKRGEVFPLNISVFNYVEQDLPIRVNLLVEDEEINAVKTEVDLCVKANNNHVESLKVSALKLGSVNITVRATIKNGIRGCSEVQNGNGFSDALVKPLRVKPEGVPVEIVKSDFKCVESGSDSFDLERLELPNNLVEGSDRAYVHVTGDVMAPALENVGNLVRLPTGCGEQNMVGLVPNIYLLEYLRGVDKKMPEIERKAKSYMTIGYNRQQNYRHDNGAYSIWGGKGDKDGSSWLTAFVVKAFSEASKFISVDARLVQESVDWLLSNQMENGCFRKRGYVHSSYLKGGGSDDSLTAFILTALQTASTSFKEVEVGQKKLAQAYDCMMKNLNTSDIYSSIVVAHAANLIKKKSDRKTVNDLMTSIEIRANTTTGKFWDIKKETVKCEYCWWSFRPSSEAVEMTAYNIMSYVLRDQLPLALDSVKWLAKQRNSQGGFVSTQDTVVALQALSMYSQKVTKIPLAMNIDITDKRSGNKLDSVQLNDDNALLLRSQKLSKLPASLDISSNGPGCALVQSVLRYNTKEVAGDNGFTVSATPLHVNSVVESPELRVCAAYSGTRDKTGMVLMEVEFVTGWEAANPDSLTALKEVQRVETDKEENKVVLYFNEMTSQETCVDIALKDVMTIEKAKDALVTVYDYYNREETASVLYNMNS